MNTPEKPLLLITLGDVAGVGPEIIARAWPELLALCRPVVCGDAGWMRRGLAGKLAHVQHTPTVCKGGAGEDRRGDAQPLQDGDCVENAAERVVERDVKDSSST